MFFPFDIGIDGSRWSSVADPGTEVSSSPLTERSELVSLDAGRGDVDFLLAPPVSGHTGTLLSDLVRGLLRAGRVHVIEQICPSQVSATQSEGCLGQQARAITLAAERLGCVHLLGACQSTAATLLAAGQISKTSDAALMSLTLIAAPIVSAPGSGGVAGHIPRDAAGRANFLGRIDEMIRQAQGGQRVLPGEIQLAAILQGSGGAARLLMEENCVSWNFTASSERRRKARLRTRILLGTRDLERGLLLDSLRRNFVSRPHTRADSPVKHITCPVLLVAGDQDSVIPAAQCHGGRRLFPAAPVTALTVPGADHFDLFCGEAAISLGADIASHLTESSQAQVAA